MTLKNLIITMAFVTAIIGMSQASALTPKEQLGKHLFFDITLSTPDGQSCSSCHDPGAGFADPDTDFPVSEGVLTGVFGGRNSPSAAYAVFFPEFTLKQGIRGGQFWDGRALNLTEQAKGPFLNPLEMNNLDRASVIAQIQITPYAALFEQECGPNAFDPGNVDTSYHCMAEAIALYEGTSEVNPFTSKYDAVITGLAEFTPEEQEGLDLFRGKGKCGHCHIAKAIDDQPVAIFTDAKYHNIGVPSNPEIFALKPDLPSDFVDLGLGAILNDPREYGKFKTNHLRNIAMTPPYMHNGVLKTLKEVVHFYNVRDIAGEFPPPEFADTMDSSFVGDLGLTDAEEDAIVSFMETLTDGFIVP